MTTMKLRQALFADIGGRRLYLYGTLWLVAGVAAVGMMALDSLQDDADAALQASADKLAHVMAVRFKLAKVSRVSQDELKAATARAFADGKLLGQRTKPVFVGSGSTKPHVEEGPPEVGDVVVTSKVGTAVVEQADKNLWWKAEVTTTVDLPKLKWTRTFTEPVVAEIEAVAPTPTADSHSVFANPVVTTPQNIARRWHLGKGFVCGPAIFAGLVTDPTYTVHAGVGVGAACVYGWGVVK